MKYCLFYFLSDTIKNFILVLSLIAPIVSYSAESKGPFFYRIEKDNKVMHALGTMHIGVNLEDLQCSNSISNILNQSSLFWTETSGVAQPLEDHPMESLILDPSGDSFQSLSEESKHILQDIFKNEDIPMSDIQSLNYLGLIGILTNYCQMQFSDLIHDSSPSLQNSLDTEILQIAIQKGIPFDYLDHEDPLMTLFEMQKSQIPFFTKDKVEEKILNFSQQCTKAKVLEELEIANKTLTKAMEDYIAGIPMNITKTVEKIFQQLNILEEDMQQTIDYIKNNILRKRNENWLNKLILAHTNTNNMFVAGGLAHFEGPYNVLDMLRKEGWTVKRMRSNCSFQDQWEELNLSP